MNCFFSSTDSTDLKTNSENHTYYLSLIVNHNSQYCAKIGFMAEYSYDKSSNISIKKNSKSKYNIKTKNKGVEKIFCTIDCDIVFEVDSDLKNRVTDLITKSKEVKVYSYGENSGMENYYGTQKVGFDYNSYVKRQNGWDKTSQFIGNEPKQPELFDYTQKLNPNNAWQRTNTISIDTKNISDLQIKYFLSKLCNNDMLSEEPLIDILIKVSKEESPEAREFFISLVEETLIDNTEDFFGIKKGGISDLQMSEISGQCREVLVQYINNPLIENKLTIKGLVEMFEIYEFEEEDVELDSKI